MWSSAAPVDAGVVARATSGAAGAGRAGVRMAAIGGALGRGTLGIAALGVPTAGRVADGVGVPATRDSGSTGVRNDGDAWNAASGLNPTSPSAFGTPLPGVMRARHFPPSCAARTANAPSADLYVNAAAFVAS